MLTSVQKEILQNLINLYQTNKGKSVKGEDIAEVMNRNPGTIRNQMQSLRSLGLVKGVPGPRGGYKPTIEAYQTLNITVSDDSFKVPMHRNGEKLEGLSVAKIEFTSVPRPEECEAAIKVLGSIKDLNIGDIVTIGPTPVNNLGIMGEIVGRDDMDNLILLDTTTIRSIPKNAIEEIASKNLISLKAEDSIRDAAKILSYKDIEGAPIIKDNKAIGMLTLTDIVEALAESKENLYVKDIMSNKVLTATKDMKIANAVEMMYKNYVGRLIIVDEDDVPVGIVTRTDLIEQITNLKNFPIMDSKKQ